MISDTGFFEGNRPALTIGLRGLVYMQIDVTGSELDLHSGSFGGNVQNPAAALSSVIARLKNEDGSIAVPGFYDEVRELTPRDREEFARLTVRRERVRRLDTGCTRSTVSPSSQSLERRGARPTLDVNGIWGGFQGEGSKTIIPAEAHAKISCRLVADMNPDLTYRARARLRRVDRAARRQGRRFARSTRACGACTPIDHPPPRPPPRASRKFSARRPCYLREGGSIPAGATFSSVLGLPVVLLGFIQPDDQIHAPNENVRLDNLEGGLRTIIRYWQTLSETEIEAL